MSKYKYKAFGLNFISDFEIPELVPGNGENDVEILYGKIEEMDGQFSDDMIFKADPSEISFQVKDIGGCRVINGKTAIIMPKDNFKHSVLRLFILTSIMGCILIQRKMIPIHGSCVMIGDSSIIIAGRSNAGKSTLTSYFLNKGYRFLSDDISVVKIDDLGDMFVQPGYPYRKLHGDSAEHHSINTDGLEKIDYEENKFLVPAHEYFVDEPKRLSALFEITPMNGCDVEIKKVKGLSKLNVLMENLYRGTLASLFKTRAFYFEQIGTIASKLDIFRVIRPENQFTCEKQAELILNELGM